MDNSIEIVPNKQYIAFKASTNFVDLVPQKEKIKFWLNIKKGVLNDPFNLARDVSKIGHHGNGDYECNLSSSSDFINLMPLVKQSYNQNA